MTLTKPQQQALLRVYQRSEAPTETFLAFRRRVQPAMGYVMIEWCGMWLGIEPDGYTHS